MKKALFTLIVALLAATGAWAQTFTFDNLKYTVTDATAKTVELTGYETAPTGALTIPATVHFEGTDYNVTNIRYNAFYTCNTLTAVTISDGVTSIGSSAFSRCSSLTEVNIPASVTNIGSRAFSRCSRLTAVTIPEGVATIGYYAFEYCSSLTVVNIPASVTSIGIGAFKYSGLTTASIGNGVTTIGEEAFQDCSSLATVSIGSGLTTIGNNAFYNCSGLTEMTVLATTPPTLGTDVFLNVSRTIPVYVPATSLADYQAADVWSEFTNLQAISTTGLPAAAMPESIRMQGGTLHNPQGLHLTLYDMQGRQVYSGTAATVSQPAGVYVVRCNGASGKVVF